MLLILAVRKSLRFYQQNAWIPESDYSKKPTTDLPMKLMTKPSSVDRRYIILNVSKM